MTDDLSNKALADVEALLVLYLSELGNLMLASPEHRWAFELTAQSRLKILRTALENVREKYEVLLPEHEIIRYGINQLASRERPFRSSGQSVKDKKLATTLQRTLEAIISEGPGVQSTLPGLLNFARTYSSQ